LVKKNKDKFRGRKSGSALRDMAAGLPAVAGGGVAEDREKRVIRTEQVYAKPMDVEEAVMQLNLSNGEFMVFTNRHTNNVNVLYRRKDGNLGLIETIA
jgi:putative sigma-54 modulation protein